MRWQGSSVMCQVHMALIFKFGKEVAMAMISRFEDIQAWQEARQLVKMIYKLTNLGPFAKDFGLRDQIERASVSAMTNIAEDFDSETKAEFARFLGISRRSAV